MSCHGSEPPLQITLCNQTNSLTSPLHLVFSWNYFVTVYLLFVMLMCECCEPDLGLCFETVETSHGPRSEDLVCLVSHLITCHVGGLQLPDWLLF